MNYRKKIGQLGENLAKKYLVQKGYNILATNYLSPVGEIDLIGQKYQVITFFEVKTRTNHNFGWPEEAVDDQKINHLTAAIDHYLTTQQIDCEWQIDIITINLNLKNKKAKLQHLLNIQEP